MFEVKKFPDFSWSLSRHKAMLNCQRKYAYDYYVSHNGWLKYNVLAESQQAYRLKKLQHLPMFFGQVAHELIEQTIVQLMNTGTVPTASELTERARKKLNEAYIHSTRQYDEWLQKPNRFNMLFDIYYHQKLNEAEVELYQERLTAIFENFLNSYTVQQLLQRGSKLSIQQAEEFRFLKIDDVKVFIVMDLLYKDNETNQWIIVDWKTGKTSTTDRQQLALYAYYLQQKLHIPLEDIIVRNEYLLQNQHVESKLEPFDIEGLLQIFGESIQYMKRFQADILTNEPVDLEYFECTQFTEQCEKCNYREVCDGAN